MHNMYTKILKKYFYSLILQSTYQTINVSWNVNNQTIHETYLRNLINIVLNNNEN